MCDFFWLPPADQGDLSDVVRASLQQLPTVAAPASGTCSHESLGAGRHDQPAEEEELLQGRANRRGDDHDVLQFQQQLLHGDCMVSSSSCDPLLLQQSPSSYPQPEPLQTEGPIPHVMFGPPPQLLGVAKLGECGEVAAPEMDEHGLDMAEMDDAHPHGPAIKRRKNQTKKVVCIPAPSAVPPGVGGRPSASGEVVPSDLWAWRKYGQKPIKGSPYPRGYYRCSSSKGCSARKQVERSRTDPSMLVITYTSDHNHPWPTQRNTLAGSTRPAASSSAGAANNKRHHRQPRHCIVGDSAAPSSIDDNVHHQQVPKQEVLDVIDRSMPGQDQDAAAVDMFAEMDGALNTMPASNFNPQKHRHATTADDDRHLEQDDKQLLLDPFSFNSFDWVGASFGIGDANKEGYA